MSALTEKLKITPEEYLAGEMDAPIRSEYVHGEVYAMAGASDGHITVTGNLFAMLKPHLRGSGCKSYISDMKVRIGADNAYYYPDLLVSCDPSDHKRNYIKHAPTLIVEVLSSSTEAYDRGGKFALYRQLESLQEYVLVDPRTYRVEIFRRNPHNRWELFSFEGETAEVEFASLNFHCPMQDIYEDVDFELAQAELPKV
ncbi:MAG: Uma2 family endonuclease [Gammaproteobacteria bacterium]|nr:Uma2 family endonuclease [Gammaproteobacteria bacterium]MBU1725325.1 Uma2 family endonuclease [Gammaproteobacteria bacterium]MBU2004334.1 Uma2 family endonuclease [Gammaproteobacteria bacterium]